jgi:hypothetical protein
VMNMSTHLAGSERKRKLIKKVTFQRTRSDR